MRFPWLQVDADFIGAHAGDLGSYLKISRREAMGLALDLWTWALARAKDDAPPDGIVTGTGAVPDRLLAGSVQWTGPAEEFTAALVAVGLAVRIDGGYRLTGFSRYKATWDKNRRRSAAKPERNRTGAGAEPEPKTQTHTQKEETTLGTDAPESVENVTPTAPGQVALVEAPRPAGPRPEDLQALWNRLAPPKGLQRWTGMSDKRRRDARISLRDSPDLSKWEAWLKHELARPWNLGENDSKWKADVDWLLRTKTRDLVNDFDPAVAARTMSGGDRPRLPPREAPPESTQPAAPARRVIL